MAIERFEDLIFEDRARLLVRGDLVLECLKFFVAIGHVQFRFQVVDFADESANISGMMRMTGYPTSVIAQLLADSILVEKGVRTPEQCVPLEPFVQALAERGIPIQRFDDVLPPQS